MRRLWVPLVFLLLACRAFSPQPAPTPITESLPGRPQPPPIATAAALPEADPFSLSRFDFEVVFHPDGALYSGDLVSIEVIPPQGLDMSKLNVQINLPPGQSAQTVEQPFEAYGIGGRTQATFLWSWDTTAMAPGEYSLEIKISPNGPHWQEQATLRPHDQLPPPEPQASWGRVESDCCLVYYISGGEAQRDLAELLVIIDQQFESANRRLDVDLGEQPLEITLLPRVLGHGGFTRGDIAVSYLDRNYAGAGAVNVLHHELVHVLDGRLGGGLRPTILVEGLAVYLTGGHFKSEPLLPRAAALLPPQPGCGVEENTPACGLDWYIPLPGLIDNFYYEQHEIGYLQAGALVAFMVDRWGWEDFSTFYRQIVPTVELRQRDESALPKFELPPYGSQSEAMDLALRKKFDIGLEELEDLFLQALREEKVEQQWAADVRLTVEYYDTVRRYQILLDPSAYFLTTWLPDSVQMRERRIVADYLRRPSLAENIALEGLLVSIDEAIRAGEYSRAEKLLAAVNAALDIFGESLDAD